MQTKEKHLTDIRAVKLWYYANMCEENECYNNKCFFIVFNLNAYSYTNDANGTQCTFFSCCMFSKEQIRVVLKAMKSVVIWRILLNLKI